MAKQTAANNKFLKAMKAWYERNGKMSISAKNNYIDISRIVNERGNEAGIEAAFNRTYRNGNELEAHLVAAGAIAAPAATPEAASEATIEEAIEDGFTRARNGKASAETEAQRLIDNALEWEDLSFVLAGVLDFDTMMMLKATRRKELDPLRAENNVLRAQLASARKLLETFARSEVGSHNHFHMATIAAARLEYIDYLAKKGAK